VKRREFLGLVGGAAAWPTVARAQQGERVRRIGVLTATTSDDAEGQARLAAFQQGLQRLGWTDGHNIRIDIHWAGATAAELRKHAAELVALAPDVIFSTGGASLAPLMQANHTLPIVFANVPDPVGSGVAKTPARPGGNASGFMQFEYSLSAKWPELLKQIAPGVKRMAVLWDPTITPGIGQFAVIQSVAPALGVEVSPVNMGETKEVEDDLAALGHSADGGLIVTGSGLTTVHRDLIIALAARHKLPAIYFQRIFTTEGGLISYGPDLFEQFRGAAAYVDRVLKGEKPADLPVQAPTKYQLAINLKPRRRLVSWCLRACWSAPTR